LSLVLSAPLPLQALHRCSEKQVIALDIGTGTGVIAAILARRGIKGVLATDIDPRAVMCAKSNMLRLGIDNVVSVIISDLFPPISMLQGRVPLVVFNPPWIPTKPSTSLERGIFDAGSKVLYGFLEGLRDRLSEDGEGWLILSDLAERFGLRSRRDFLKKVADCNLVVLERIDAQNKNCINYLSSDDVLSNARESEIVSLWRLGNAAKSRNEMTIVNKSSTSFPIAK
jgi:methylase of polypeptide subunit release factors